MRVAAILFDIDGTLVDSGPSVLRAWRAWAEEHGLDPDAVVEDVHGVRSADVVARFLPEDEQEAGVARIDELEREDVDGVATPGAADVLAMLPAGRWAAVTSGPRELMTRRLEAAGLPVPATMITSDDVDAGKPDPEGYAAAAAALGVSGAECAVIEDSPAGVRAGRAAGAFVVALTTTHEEAHLVGADLVVADLTALHVRVDDDGIDIERDRTNA